MPASSATSGYGVLWKDNSTGSLAAVAEVSKIGNVGQNVDMIDVTNLTSPSDAQEFITGVIKNELIAIELNFLPGAAAGQSQRNINAAVQNRNKLTFNIMWNDAAATVWSFSGFYKSFVVTDVVVDNKQVARAQIQPTGLLSIPS